MIFVFFSSAIFFASSHSGITVSQSSLPLTEFDIEEDDDEFRKQVFQILISLNNLKIELKSGLLVETAKWQNWEIGKELLTKLNELLKRRKKRLKIKQVKNGNINFSADEKEDCTLEIDMYKLKNSKVQCLRFDLDTDSAEEYKIGSSPNPPHVTIGHELIHAIHRLDDISEKDLPMVIKWLPAKSAESAAQRTENFRLFKYSEQEERKLRYELFKYNKQTLDDKIWPKNLHEVKSNANWQDLEEQRTVIGTQEHVLNEFSEFWLRLACGLFPRYSYGNATTHFLEKKAYVDFIMKKLMGANWKQYILKHCQNNLEQYEFHQPEEQTLVAVVQTRKKNSTNSVSLALQTRLAAAAGSRRNSRTTLDSHQTQEEEKGTVNLTQVRQIQV